MWPFSRSYPEVPPSDVDGKTYDYIIVGGGTAGCAVASRLSENPEVSVLVLEKGRVKDIFLSRIPLVSQNFLFGDKFQVVSDHFSEPAPQANGLKMKLWTAEGLGGASRINGMVMTRGAPGDYNAWAQEMGLDDWSWEHVEPFFQKSENAVAHPASSARGHNGPIMIQQFPTPFAWGPYIDKAARKVGLPIVEDVNDPKAPAMGLYRLDQAVDERGHRNTSYQAFLNKRIACERQTHLTICTGAMASRLDVDSDAGSVRGVFIHAATPGKPSKDFYVKARREVIVCCGGLRTPQILMLSGIGPRDELQAKGITPAQDLPVGRTLSDHYAFPIMLELPKRETLHILESTIFVLWNLLLWLIFSTGLVSSGSNYSTIFVRSGAIDDKTMAIQERIPGHDDSSQGADNMDISQPRNVPDIEVMLFAVNGFKRPLPGRTLFSLYACVVQPHSTGRVELADSDSLSHPRVTHPVLRDERDWPVARKAVRFTMRLAQEFQNSGYPYPAPFAFAPGNNLDKLADPQGLQIPATPQTPPSSGAAKTWESVTDNEIDRYIRSVATVSLHPSCSCRMSNDPRLGVVDQRLRVHGLDNLRIADTSVFPRMLSSHTMWPAIMVGERCADFITRDWNLE
ncbi:alcohol oxidase [Cryphonectria parasitica EP155]|uniref:Alcohol oxidase n=1 Tax=Cryphonectria parasitica (strain ATCC 38755 / EP155) TaxID=660469 RepID=A0A9P5CMC6_CRYP1|nr:alcohol oxidase [Cryphonectria parasitica EP155]KAF3762951.1 alcohol oxidase [Cryphonectria parasitica EP155]